MSATSAIVLAMAAKRHRLIRRFFQAHAFSPKTALALESLPHANRLLRQLCEQEILVLVPGDKMYLDTARFESVSSSKRAFAIEMVMIAVILGGMFATMAFFLPTA